MCYFAEPNDPTELHPTSVYKCLVEEMCYMWFDLFKALGVDFKLLESIRQQYPFDPDASLFEVIREWLGGRASKIEPSWKALVDVLRSEMLEAKLADAIAEKHFSATDLQAYKQGALCVDVCWVHDNIQA
jgi:hypothetical protein